MNMKVIVVKVSEETKKLLDELKIIPDETYNHVIERALKLLKEEGKKH
jgi:predicted nucleic acid-binding protein